MNIKGAVAVITGAGGGIGRALALELAKREIGSIALVDHSDAVKDVMNAVNQSVGKPVAKGYVGDVTDATFRNRVFAGVRDIDELRGRGRRQECGQQAGRRETS